MVILCAEDELAMQRFILKVLTADGHTVLAAGDGAAALEASRKYPGYIDLLLSDVAMPRMGGLELRSNVAVERPGIKVLMMSGALEGREEVAMNGLPFLQKPFSATDLRHSIQTLLD